MNQVHKAYKSPIHSEFGYKIDHISKPKNRKTVHSIHKSVAEHCMSVFGTGPVITRLFRNKATNNLCRQLPFNILFEFLERQRQLARMSEIGT